MLCFALTLKLPRLSEAPPAAVDDIVAVGLRETPVKDARGTGCDLSADGGMFAPGETLPLRMLSVADFTCREEELGPILGLGAPVLMEGVALFFMIPPPSLPEAPGAGVDARSFNASISLAMPALTDSCSRSVDA